MFWCFLPALLPALVQILKQCMWPTSAFTLHRIYGSAREYCLLLFNISQLFHTAAKIIAWVIHELAVALIVH